MIAHNVYFQLKDASEVRKAELVSACERLLKGHDGTVFFACGTRAASLNREVNDAAFDVALHVVFESLAAHDAYQEHPRHVKFVEENKTNWAHVRVFDSEVSSGD